MPLGKEINQNLIKNAKKIAAKPQRFKESI